MTRHTYRVLDLLIKAMILVVLIVGLNGCAQGIVYKPAPKPKSTVAENIEAGGRVAAGAFDRLFKSEK